MFYPLVVLCLALLQPISLSAPLPHPPHPTTEHHCIHDAPWFAEHAAATDASNAGRVATLSGNGRPVAALSSEAAPAREPIRITPAFDNLHDPAHYCPGAGVVRPTFLSRTPSTTCWPAAVLTAHHRRILIDHALPRAVAALHSVLTVSPLAGALVSDARCNGATLPAALSNGGLNATDFALVVSAAPTSPGVAAWAYTCASLPLSPGSDRTRPVLGHINFAAAYVAWPATREGQRQVVATAVHEMVHALGFSTTRLRSPAAAFLTGFQYLRGKEVRLFTGPRLVAAARAFFNCSTLEGLELEDEGGSGSSISHWDRRVMPFEVMAPSGGQFLSGITLAALEDLDIGYGARPALAESPVFGRNAGCGFVTDRCTEASGGRGPWWCFEPTESACSFDHTSRGYCAVQTLASPVTPAAFRHFADARMTGGPFLDGCPLRRAYANGRCSEAATSSATGEAGGSTSKCFVTHGVGRGATPGPAQTGHCYTTRCDGPRLSFRVGDGPWYDCTKAGTVVNLGPDGWYTGTVECPDPAVVCEAAHYSNQGELGVFGLFDHTAGSAAPPPPSPLASLGAAVLLSLGAIAL